LARSQSADNPHGLTSPSQQRTLSGVAHPTDSDLEVVEEADDPLTVALRGHQLIEELMNVAISDRLAEPHAVEVEAMGFGIKSDLVLALGVLPESFRGLLKAINRVRNRFAHDRRASFGQEEARDLYNTLPPQGRLPDVTTDSEPILILRVAVISAYVNLEAAVRGYRDEKAGLAASEEYLRATIDRMFPGGPPPGRSRTFVKERVEADRAEREKRGEL
jgi:hypothetical protein